MIAAAQRVLDEWDQDDSGYCEVRGEGGACDDVASAMQQVIYNKLDDVSIAEGGQPGDDHAFSLVYNDTEAYALDIPANVYETGGGYRWRKRKGVRLKPSDIVIEKINRRDIVVDDDGYVRGCARGGSFRSRKKSNRRRRS